MPVPLRISAQSRRAYQLPPTGADARLMAHRPRREVDTVTTNATKQAMEPRTAVRLQLAPSPIPNDFPLSVDRCGSAEE